MGPGDGWVELAGSASKADTANWGWALGAGTFSQVQVPTVPCPSSLGGRGGGQGEPPGSYRGEAEAAVGAWHG